MSKENRYLVYERYSEVIDAIFNYQDQQVELREMCLKIMLGTLALVGGVLFVKVEVSSQSLLIMSAIFPFLSLIIVTVNMMIDLFYKERLKLAFVSEALRLENSYKWLPKFHTALLNGNLQTHLAAGGQILYYLGSAGLLLLMSAISLSIDPLFESVFDKIMILFFYVLFYFLYQYFAKKIIKNTSYILEALNGE